MIFYLLFWIVLSGVIIWGVKYITERGQGSTPSSKEDVLNILKKRYIKGEINKEEFEQKKRSFWNDE